MELSNVDEYAVWNGAAGAHRLRHQAQDDEEAGALQPLLRAATAVQPGERVLDIGCGTGQSTRDAGRAAAPGPVLGVDLSAGMLDRARELTADAGLDNVRYEQADAQVHRFEPESFDLAMSRFGVMFFGDPVAAFGNIGRAVRPGGRLVVMVWQSRERNEWASAIREALTAEVAATPDVRAAVDSPFSLADPPTVTGILEAAGFADVALQDVNEPNHLGADAQSAYEFVRGLWSTGTLLERLTPEQAERACDRLRAVMAAHDTGQGVLFDSRVWIVTARRP
jgi:ubiquinone/menaquinone biosynthesis C-methylase UbiE